MEQVFGIFGDRQGRGRMKTDGKTLRMAYTARSMAIVTGEMIPTNLAESRLARSVMVHIEKDSIDLKKLTVLQINKEKLSYAFKKYIEWIIKNENTIKNKAIIMMKNLRENQNNELHGRLNDATNVMKIGFSIFLDFVKEYNIIDEVRQQELMNIADEVFANTGVEQVEEMENADPVAMFYNAIFELKNTDRICLLDYNTGEKLNKYSKGKIVGFLDEKDECYYFYPETIYNEINSFYKNEFPLNKGALLKKLSARHCLIQHAEHRMKVKRTNPKTKEAMPVIAVRLPDNKEDNQSL